MTIQTNGDELERQRFEVAIRDKFGNLVDLRICANGDSEYLAWDAQVAYYAWQTSRNAIKIDLPPVCDVHSDDTDKGYDICHYRVQGKLKEQGFSFKIEGEERWQP